MTASMTGLGASEVHYNQSVVVVDIKSFNNRFLEISCRLSPSLTPFEKEIKDLIRKSVDRGKLYVNVSLQGEKPEDLGLCINASKVRAIQLLLQELRKAAGLREKLTLEHYLKFTEILEPDSKPETAEALWETLRKAVSAALDRLQAMRRQEGGALAADLLERTRRLYEGVDSLEALSKQRLPEIYGRMRDRVRQLTEDKDLDENRMHQEIALLSDRMDVTEECVRMRSHCALFERTLGEDRAVGKKLTFLLQEMNREVNTICSKANDAEISHSAVAMKEEIEKMREQSQNLE
ncbi:YicC family protein [bacterium]|nr:YicC family protein [bacterium]